MQRYIGLDVHAASSTLAVVSETGKRLRSFPVETNGRALVEAIRLIPGHRHVVLEEGTQSAWLYETLAPHVDDIVVAGVTTSRGQKNDALDAFRLAERLRSGTLDKTIFKAPRRFTALRELARVHGMISRDLVRVQARIKSIYRSRGVATAGTRSVYAATKREEWLEETAAGAWLRGQVQQTRGLTRFHNHTLKDIFKGAATTVITHPGADPVYATYSRMTDGGTKPNLAKVSLARTIAAITLRMWKDEEVYNAATLRG